ncbi:MAG: hypothetical protein JWN66_3085 [Sphingomonas bacterium]|uniref:hypothetical protein n=1 Tax=Sphingomonas bacterium TaxID=1895847 RepID=UPI002605D97C|nr:hypothetical protein [Sphingomonas bacterium]MDB5705969.1 hypothetical protein [Sphingomonas bacterium]
MRPVAIATILLLFLAVMYGAFFEVSATLNEEFIRLAPPPVRTYYLDKVFLNSDNECRGCRFRVISALHMIRKDLDESQNSYDYDYGKILPFIRSDTYGGFEEPIPMMACIIVLRYNDRQLFEKMAAMYRQTPGILRECIHSGLYWIKEDSGPAPHALVYDNLDSIPALSPLVHNIPEAIR